MVHTPDNIQNILIILMGALGDVVRGFVMLSPLKQHFKNAKITWLVEPRCQGIVKMHPLIDEVLVFDRNRGIRGVPDLYRALKKQNYDLVFDLQRHSKSGFFSFLSRGKRRIGFHRKDSKELNWLFNNDHIRYCGESLPKVLHYMEFLKHIGIEIGTEPDFGLDRDQNRAVLNTIEGGPKDRFIALVLGSTWPSKDWLPSGYQKLIEKLLQDESCDVVLMGDKTQVELSSKLKQGFSDSRVLDLAGKTSLKQLVSLVSNADLIIGPDSGPGHIAGAVSTPYISLFGPTSPVRTSPFGSEDLVVSADLGCMPCYRRVCPGLDKLCMRLISVDAIMEKVRVVRGREGQVRSV